MKEPIQYINQLFHKFPDNNEAQWKMLRRAHISGTDSAILLGLNPWRTPVKLYFEKMEGEEVQQNISMRRGKALEPLVAEIYCEETNAVIINPEHKYFVHPDHPIFGGTPDRFALIGDDIVVLEIKTAVSFGCQKFDGGIPPYYMVQGMQYLWIMDALLKHEGFKGNVYLDFAVLLDDRFEMYNGITLDQTVIDQIKHAGYLFKENYLDKAVMPRPSDLDDLKKVYRDVVLGSYIEVGEEFYELLRMRKALKEAIDKDSAPIAQLRNNLETIEFRIKDYIGNNESVLYQGEEIATLKMNKNGVRTLRVKEKFILQEESF